MAQPGTSPQQTPAPAPPPHEKHVFDHATMIADAVAKQGPPPPGMGKLVDKTI
jgi:hypothetical protein